MLGITEVLQKVHAAISEVASTHSLTRHFASCDLLADSGLTSLAFVDLMFAIEREFDLTISDRELVTENFVTANSIAAMIERLIQDGRREALRLSPSAQAA